MMIGTQIAGGLVLGVAALPLAQLAPWGGQSASEALRSEDSASAWELRARAAERASDVDGALLAWLEALVREDTPARRAEAGRIAAPFERLLATVRLPVPEGHRWEPDLCCSHDGVHVACSASDVLVFEAATGRVVARLSDALARSATGGDPAGRLPDEWAHRLAFDPSGPRLVALYADETLILDYEQGLAHRIALPVSENHARAVAWRPDGARVAVAVPMKAAGEEGYVETVREWDVGRQRWCVGEWELPGEPVGLVYSPDGAVIAAYGLGLHLLRRDAGGVPSATTVPSLELEGFVSGNGVPACAFHPTEPLLAFIAGEYGIATWHLTDARYVGPLYGMCVTGRDELAYDRSGTRLVLGNRLGVRSYDARTGAPLAPPSRDDGLEDTWREKYADSALSLAPDGARFAMAGIADTVRLFDDQSGEPLIPCIRHGAQVVALDMGPGALLVTASANGVVRTWQLGREVTAPPPPRTACSVELLNDRRHALVAELGTELIVFDRAGHDRTLHIGGELGYSGLIGVSGDGRRVAATFIDGSRLTLRVIDLATGADVGPPLSLGFLWESGDAGVPPLDQRGERVLVRTVGEAFEYEVATGRCLTARGDDAERYDAAEEDDAGRRILARGVDQLARVDAEGSVFVTDGASNHTVRMVDADDNPGQAAVGAGWYVEAAGPMLRVFDSETGALRFNYECQGEVAGLPRYSVRDQLIVGVKRETWHVVDLDAVPREGDVRHVILARDSLHRFEQSEDDPATRRAIGSVVAWARRLFRSPTLPSPDLDIEYDSALYGPNVLVHLDRLEGAQRSPLASRRQDPTLHDVLGGDLRLRSDLRYVKSAVNVEGGVDVRVVDFARPGDVSLAGEPRALLEAWRRRLGR